MADNESQQDGIVHEDGQFEEVLPRSQRKTKGKIKKNNDFDYSTRTR
ncbi:hypothetical protein A2U01_0075456, partial [Trifolium medium]|nr:hypothetical protein [Trifolium medium]